MNPKVSIVVPTLNRCEMLARVLPTFARQSFPPDGFEILLCDGGSTDGTFELIGRLALPNLRVLACHGLARGPSRNVGIRCARAPLVLFTDADILADRELVARHVAAQERQVGAAVLGCEVRVDSQQEYEAACADLRARRVLHPPWRRRLPWFFFITGNASVARDTLIHVGLFDDRFVAYGHEDLELGYRLRRAGVRLCYEPTAINYHWHPETLGARLEKMEASGRATIRMYRKHKDRRILWRMGVNPIAWGLHSLLGGAPATARWRARAERSTLARSVALQLAYGSGAKAEWRQPGAAP